MQSLCLLQEAMRLQPVAAMPNQRVALRDIHLSNSVTIPAGVKIDLAQYTVMRSEAWGWKDGSSFVPERWEEPDMEYFHVKSASAGSNGAKLGGAAIAKDDLEIDAAQGGDDKVASKYYLLCGGLVLNLLQV